MNGVTVQVSMCACSLKITELGHFRAQVADHSVCGGRLTLIAGISACVCGVKDKSRPGDAFPLYSIRPNS